MNHWWRTGATLLVGAGIGTFVTRLVPGAGAERCQECQGLLSTLPVLPVPAVHASELTVSSGTAVMKYGFPSLSNIKSRDSYVTSYDPRTRTASWVVEKLSSASLLGSSDRKLCEFKEDDSIHVFHRATNSDFRGSGFDRGHLAAAGNHKRSQKAMEDTFYLSNIAPQNPHLNQNAWNNLEKLCRSLTRSYLNVYVCTGPLYLPRQESDGKLYVHYQVLGRNHVAVPTHFFKVLILERPGSQGVELRSYLLPNTPVDEKIPLEHFLVPIETIERASGLLFVPNIMKRSGSLQSISARSP
ncbi:endonuclease G, mitochondrial [Neosynchiropus ocellatus]